MRIPSSSSTGEGRELARPYNIGESAQFANRAAVGSVQFFNAQFGHSDFPCLAGMIRIIPEDNRPANSPP
jgi:hypothetical protein